MMEELSILDQLFERVRDKDPYHVAVKYYDDYRRGAADTLRSVQVTLASRLTKFNLQSISNITYVDEMDLDSIGEEKPRYLQLFPTMTSPTILLSECCIRSCFNDYFIWQIKSTVVLYLCRCIF